MIVSILYFTTSCKSSARATLPFELYLAFSTYNPEFVTLVLQ